MFKLAPHKHLPRESQEKIMKTLVEYSLSHGGEEKFDSLLKVQYRDELEINPDLEPGEETTIKREMLDIACRRYWSIATLPPMLTEHSTVSEFHTMAVINQIFKDAEKRRSIWRSTFFAEVRSVKLAVSHGFNRGLYKKPDSEQTEKALENYHEEREESQRKGIESFYKYLAQMEDMSGASRQFIIQRYVSDYVRTSPNGWSWYTSEGEINDVDSEIEVECAIDDLAEMWERMEQTYKLSEDFPDWVWVEGPSHVV